MEPSTISGLSVDGSALDIEPSMMRGVFVEGSGLGNGTFHDARRFHGGFDSEEWNLPRFRASAWMVPLWMLNLPCMNPEYGCFDMIKHMELVIIMSTFI